MTELENEMVHMSREQLEQAYLQLANAIPHVYRDVLSIARTCHVLGDVALTHPNPEVRAGVIGLLDQLDDAVRSYLPPPKPQQ